MKKKTSAILKKPKEQREILKKRTKQIIWEKS